MFQNENDYWNYYLNALLSLEIIDSKNILTGDLAVRVYGVFFSGS